MRLHNLPFKEIKIAENHGTKSFPMLVFFKDNELKDRLLGPLKSDKIKAVLENI
jgi:thioredoxin-like negative regulator of GroEL